MTAEEKLKELKEEMERRGDSMGTSLTPADIDLIANLVIERLKLVSRETIGSLSR